MPNELPQDLTNALGPDIAALINQGAAQGPSARNEYVTAPTAADQYTPQAESGNEPPPIQPDIQAGSHNAMLSSLISGGVPDSALTPPMIKGGLTSEQAAGPPRPTIGGLPGLVLDLIHPGRNVAPGQMVPSKLDRFESFLGNFLQSLSTGLAQEGTGPGAAMRGAAAAMQAPYQQALQQYGLQQQGRMQQAQLAAEQAKTQQTRIQTQRMGTSTMVTMPNGAQVMVPNDQLANVLKSMAPAQARLGAAELQAGAKLSTQDNVNRVLGEARDALAKGDVATYQAKLKEAGEMAAAKKPPVVKNNETEWIARLINDPNDTKADAMLKKLQSNRKEIMEARGISIGKGRLYQLQSVYHPDTGETDLMTGFQYLEGKANGENLVPAGKVGQKDIEAVQQLRSEATPALKQVRSALSAFDNTSDRLLFARVMKSVGTPSAGNEHSWFQNVVDQVAKSGLSQKGQDLLIAEARMAETLGRMRGVLGLHATDSAMALTLKLMASYDTPNSKYAGKQIDTLEEMIKYATEIPAFTGKKGTSSGGAEKSSPKVNKDGYPIYGK